MDGALEVRAGAVAVVREEPDARPQRRARILAELDRNGSVRVGELVSCSASPT